MGISCHLHRAYCEGLLFSPFPGTWSAGKITSLRLDYTPGALRPKSTQGPLNTAQVCVVLLGGACKPHGEGQAWEAGARQNDGNCVFYPMCLLFHSSTEQILIGHPLCTNYCS